jgi:hypothetical protein
MALSKFGLQQSQLKMNPVKNQQVQTKRERRLMIVVEKSRQDLFH